MTPKHRILLPLDGVQKALMKHLCSEHIHIFPHNFIFLSTLYTNTASTSPPAPLSSPPMPPKLMLSYLVIIVTSIYMYMCVCVCVCANMYV